MFSELTELDILEFRLGYAHAILEVGVGTIDDEEWEDVGPDSFTQKSVKRMRNDCIMFLARLFEQVELSPAQLAGQVGFYDLGFQFYLARIDFSGFVKLELGPLSDVLDRISDDDFGGVFPEISRRRIHYPERAPSIFKTDAEAAARLRRAARKRISRCGIVDDPDVYRGVQRHNYNGYA